MLNIEIEVLFEILLSVGVSQDLDESINDFLSKNVKLLNRSAGAIVRHNTGAQETFKVLASLPHSFTKNEDFQRVVQKSMSASKSHVHGHFRETVEKRNASFNYDVFDIPGLGSLVLYGAPLEVSTVFLGHYNLVLRKFAASCQASVLRAENEQQSRRLELATRAARIGTWEMDVNTGKLYIDDRTLSLFAIKDQKHQFTLEEFLAYVYEDDRASVLAHVGNYINQAVDEPTEYYYRVQREDGEFRKLAANATLVFENGKPSRLVGVNYDITEAELARTQSMYRSELESLLISLSVDLIKNHDQNLDAVVNNALQAAGEFVGADRAYRFEYDFSREVTSNTHEWCADGIPKEIDSLQDVPVSAIPLWVTAHKSGLPFFVRSVQELPPEHVLRQILEPQGIRSLVTIPLMNDDECLGFIGFDAVKQERLWTDVDLSLLRLLADLLVNADMRIRHESLIRQQNLALTNARDHAEILAQDAQAASIAKSRFVARVSHEIRTPLHAILGLTELVLAEQPSNQIKDLALTIKESGSVLLDLINDVLDFAKAESNEVILDPKDFMLSELLESLESMFRPLAEEKNLDFSISLAASVAPIYHGDRLRIRQIVTNFLSNAIKFTDSGHIKVEIDNHLTHQEWLIIRVHDTGIGIPHADIEKLFAPFFQSDNAQTKMLNGTGLGLTISQALADRMGGKILVTSEQSRGSVFTLEVPLQRGNAEAKSLSVSSKQKTATLPNRISVLLAEDNPINVRLVQAYLKDTVAEVICVSDGQQAVQAILDHHKAFDIILMDCNMPVMDGYDATRAIRSAEKSSDRTPVIAVTAGALEGEKDQAMEAGMDDVLVKPFSKDQLLDVIYRHTRSYC